MESPPRSGTGGSNLSSSKTRAPALRPRTTCGGQQEHLMVPQTPPTSPAPPRAPNLNPQPHPTYLAHQDGDVGQGPGMHKGRG